AIPAAASSGPASAGRRGSRPPIPGGSASGRYPRSAAGTVPDPPAAPRSARQKRGPDAAARWARAQTASAGPGRLLRRQPRAEILLGAVGIGRIAILAAAAAAARLDRGEQAEIDVHRLKGL